MPIGEQHRLLSRSSLAHRRLTVVPVPFSTFGAGFGGFSKPDISAPFGMRGLAHPQTPYLTKGAANVIISKPAPGASTGSPHDSTHCHDAAIGYFKVAP